jgi:hypothetical protein
LKVSVIDSSSIIEIREIVPRTPPSLRNGVYAALDGLVAAVTLCFPHQVLGELHRGASAKSSDPHDPYVWARKHEAQSKRFGPLYAEAAEVQEQVDNLVDPDESGPDPADPYVIAYAGKPPHLTALSVAAGHFGFPSVNMRHFLKSQRIWPLAAAAGAAPGIAAAAAGDPAS